MTSKLEAWSVRHGPQRLADGTVQFTVWAPRAASARLVLYDFATITGEVVMLPDECGSFVSPAMNVVDGQRYGVRLDRHVVRPDPATRWQPEGVHLPSATWFPDQFEWHDACWRGVRQSELVIYELHVGAFTAEGTLDAIVPRLRDLVDLGITAIELMPIAQFPGGRNWGYDGVHPFCVQNTYGGPQGLQHLVDECHRVGIAVILDVVYNHLGPEGNYLNEFGPYFTERYHTPWGMAFNFDQPGCEGVRSFVLENARYWIRDFHIDGLRLDAVHAIFDLSPSHILQEIKGVSEEEGIRRGWPAHVIAESDENDTRLLNPRGHGLGLDAIWNDDFHHSVYALLSGERHGYYVDYGHPTHLAKALNQSFVYDGCHSTYRGRGHGTSANHLAGDRFIVCLQNHDQVGNRVHGDRIGSRISTSQQRLAAGLLLLSPYIPLLFMGEEYAETRPFPYFCSFLDTALVESIVQGRHAEHAGSDLLDLTLNPQSEATFASATLRWDWPGDSHAAGIRRLYRDLLAARRMWPVFRDFSNRHADLLPNPESAPVLRLIRGSKSSEAPGSIVALFNLTDQPQPLQPAWRGRSPLLLTSEARRYRGGRGRTDPLDVLMPHEFHVYGSPDWKQL